MTNTNLVEFKTIYPDIERYLAEYHEHFVNINMIVDIDKHYCLVTLANNDEALSITKESLIKLLSLIGCE